MGYYTQYTLSILEGDQEIIKKFREENQNANYAIEDDGSSSDSCKWYDSDKELIAFSLKNPKVLFLLEGIGEENGDEWKLYVQDGHTQKCKGTMVFPEFDKAKLLAEIRDSKLKSIGI